MRIIAKKTLRNFWMKHKQAKPFLEAWHADAQQSHWHSPQDIKNEYRNASFLGDNRVVFNIKGNRYRLIVKINFNHQIVYIRFIGTHKEYDQIDAETV